MNVYQWIWMLAFRKNLHLILNEYIHFHVKLDKNVLYGIEFLLVLCGLVYRLVNISVNYNPLVCFRPKQICYDSVANIIKPKFFHFVFTTERLGGETTRSHDWYWINRNTHINIKLRIKKNIHAIIIEWIDGNDVKY